MALYCLAGTHCLPTWLACLRSGHSPLDADRCSLTSGWCCFVAGTRQRFPPRCSVRAVHRLRISTNGWAPNRTMARSELGLARRRMWQRWRTLGVAAAARCVPAQHARILHAHKRLARKRRRETTLPSWVVQSLHATAVFSVLPVALSANSHVNCCCCVVIHAHVTTERQSASNGHSAERTTEQITAATWCCQEIHRALALLTGSATCLGAEAQVCVAYVLYLVCLLRTRIMYVHAGA